MRNAPLVACGSGRPRPYKTLVYSSTCELITQHSQASLQISTMVIMAFSIEGMGTYS